MFEISDILFVQSSEGNEYIRFSKLYKEIEKNNKLYQKHTSIDDKNSFNNDIDVSIWNLIDLEDYDKMIDILAESIEEKGHRYLFHFDFHGDKNGILLKSGENVSWTRLALDLSRLNGLSENNQLLCLATCYSEYFINSIKLNSLTPFASCICSVGEILDNEVETFYSSFYDKILKGDFYNFDILQIYDNAKKECGKFFYIQSDFLFEAKFPKTLADTIFDPKLDLIKGYSNILEYNDIIKEYDRVMSEQEEFRNYKKYLKRIFLG